MNITGIYKIQSIIHPTRFYIGSGINIHRRWRNHLAELKMNKHHSIILQNHYNKYGVNDLVFIIIEPCFSEFLTIREQHYIDSLKPYFNVCKFAGNWLGMRHSNESKLKNSESHKGRVTTLGRHWTLSKEARENISKGHMGLRKSRESILKTIQSHMKKVINSATNEIFDSMKDAAKSIGMNYQTFRSQMSDKVKNNTGFVYLK